MIQKVAIETEKVAFEQRLWDMKASTPTIEKTKALFDAFGYDRAFSRADIMEMFDMASSSVGKYLNKLKEYGMIEAITDHGKGKYKFSR